MKLIPVVVFVCFLNRRNSRTNELLEHQKSDQMIFQQLSICTKKYSYIALKLTQG